MAEVDLVDVTELILGRGGNGAQPGQEAAQPRAAPLFIGSVVSQSGTAANPVWQVADLESPEVVVTIRGYVRLLVVSAAMAEGGRTLPAGTIVLAVERSGEYLLLGQPGLYS